VSAIEDEWLWGWDPTPGIVSVWAEPDGRAFVWRRSTGEAEFTGGGRESAPDRRPLVREDVRFRPWVLLASLRDLRHLGGRLSPERDGAARGRVTFQELEGPGELRFLVRADDGRELAQAIFRGASRRLGREIKSLRELGQEEALSLPPEEQYLVASGRTYFRDLGFDDLRRMQIDLETTSLDPDSGRIFLAAMRDPDGESHVIEAARSVGAPSPSGGRARDDDDDAEAELIAGIVEHVRRFDPDVIENHNLHGFDLPFLARRAKWLGVPLALGRAGSPGLRQRPAARGASFARERGAEFPREEGVWGAGHVGATRGPIVDKGVGGRDMGTPSPGGGRNSGSRGPEGAPREAMRRARYTVPGREMIDTFDAVLRHDFSARDLPGHGLKAVAKHFRLAREDREYIPGADVYNVFQTDPARVRRYATDDVHEAAGIARLLGGSAFALAKMAPRRYERLADAGAATGVIDPLLVRAYLRAGAALPAHEAGDGTTHTGAALHLFATGIARRVVKADVASLYPSLMREHRIGPARDRLGVMVTLVDRLVELRLAAKARAKELPRGSPERHTNEALSAAMKLVVNSAYGYLAAVGLTRFADVHAANEVTRRGRETLSLLCRELSARGVTLLEADTDGVYFAVPEAFTEADERRVVSEVAALLPPRVHLEFEGRYAAMLSHEPKNYALRPYDGDVVLRGVAFRSSRAEPFGEAFLRRALECLLRGDVAGAREAYVDTVMALRRRTIPTADVTARVRLTKSPAQYRAIRAARRELSYEAMLANGRETWAYGDRVRVYRAEGGRAGLLPDVDEDEESPELEGDPRAIGRREPRRDYDVDYYVRVLQTSFASRLVRALSHEDYLAVIADPEQPSLFAPKLDEARPILTILEEPLSSG